MTLRNKDNQSTTVCFVDLKKAYDRVNHRALFHHLLKVGINGNSLKTLKALYEDNFSTVRTVFGESPKFKY